MSHGGGHHRGANRLGLAISSVAVAVVVAAGILAGREARPQAASGRAPARARARWLGAASCSAFACHGGHGPDGDARSAYLTWMARDPHSRAWAVLQDELSARIEARLAAATGRPPAHADDDARCLGCHVRPGEGTTEHLPRLTRREGVSCESCHGLAAGWIEDHSLKAWQSLTEAAKAARGMTPTRGLVARARLCAGCHVGGAGRDVGHDLIAAGHPRLNFEFRSYLDALPAHWDAARERAGAEDFEARAWAVGQAVAASEALGLLAERTRAARNRGEGAWIEFAEYACDSCHHGLVEPLGAPRPRAGGPQPGRPRWGTWYYPMLASLAERHGGLEAPGERAALADLERLMGGSAPPPAEVERQALRARALIERRLADGQATERFDLDRVRALLDRLTAPETPDRRGWDAEAQLVLALEALERAHRRPGQPRGALLRQLRRAVALRLSGELPDENPSGSFEDLLGRYRRSLNEAAP